MGRSDTPMLPIASKISWNHRNPIGPTISAIENKLQCVVMPKRTNTKLSPSGISPHSSGSLIHNFGLNAASLYQLIRLMKWEIFLTNPMSDFGKIKIIIIYMMKSIFKLDDDYISCYFKAPMVSTKDKCRQSTVSDRLSRMFIDYRNDQLLQWHKCIKLPTRQSLRGALSSYFFSDLESTSYCNGTLIPMGIDEKASILTMTAK
jgi:hypothetical protein